MMSRLGGLALLLAAFAGLALLGAGDRFLAFVIGIAMLNVLWASGMNLLYGFAGLMPLMFAGLAGVSAYATIALVTELGWSFWVAMPVSAIGAAVVGVVLGLPSLRLTGFYFTLSSMVIQTVMTMLFIFFPRFTNGDTGINQIPPPDIPFTGGTPLQGTPFDLMLAGLAWLAVACVWAVMRSSFGRSLIALREDPFLAETLGIDVVRCKLVAFFIGSLFAGCGGSLYAVTTGFVSPRAFDILISLNIWLMVAFGGRGTLVGPVLGALILAPLPFFLQRYDSLKDIIYGVLLILVITLLPGGIYGELKRLVIRARPPVRPPAAVTNKVSG
jgi:branched-chain amino acid transport system permease protein